MSNVNILDLAAARIELADMISQSEKRNVIGGIVREQVRAMHGKKISKRLATAIKTRLAALGFGDTVVYWELSGVSYRVSIWGGDVARDHDRRVSFTVGVDKCDGAMFQDTAGTFDASKWADFNPSHAALPEFMDVWRASMDKLEDWHRKAVAVDAQAKLLSAELTRNGVGWLMPHLPSRG